MECGIFALLGVVVGVIAARGASLKLNVKKKKSGGDEKDEKKEEKSVMQQWENLLSYDGKGK